MTPPVSLEERRAQLLAQKAPPYCVAIYQKKDRNLPTFTAFLASLPDVIAEKFREDLDGSPGYLGKLEQIVELEPEQREERHFTLFPRVDEQQLDLTYFIESPYAALLTQVRALEVRTLLLQTDDTTNTTRCYAHHTIGDVFSAVRHFNDLAATPAEQRIANILSAGVAKQLREYNGEIPQLCLSTALIMPEERYIIGVHEPLIIGDFIASLQDDEYTVRFCPENREAQG